MEPGSWQELQFSGQTAQGQSTLSGRVQSLAAAADVCAAPGWQAVDTANQKARVWWNSHRPQDEARAHAFANELDSYLWNKLTSAFRSPEKDLQSLNADGTRNYFCGDDRLDISLTNSRTVQTADTSSVLIVCDGRPTGARILLTPRSNKAELAHELMHAIQYAFPTYVCQTPSELDWMGEATAHWALNYAYPASNQEHGGIANGIRYVGAVDFLQDPGQSLDFQDKAHEYGAYLWFMHLGGQGNNAGPVRAAWEGVSNKTSLEAIEAVLQSSGLGGFHDQWPKFVLRAWNRLPGLNNPYREFFQWDKLRHKAIELNGVEERKLQTSNGVGGLIDPVYHDLPPLSTRYAHFIYKPDSKIHQIIFTNDYANAEPRASVQAIIKVKGQWNTADDWTDTKRKFFCMDKPDEKLEELVLVISNRDYLNRTNLGGPQTVQSSPVTVSYGSLPCYDWVGSVNYFDYDLNSNKTTTSNATGVRFTIDGSRTDLVFNYYTATAGVVNWHISETPSGCSQFDADGSYAAQGELRVVAGGAPFYVADDTGPGDGKLVRGTCTGGPTDLFYSAPNWIDINFTPFTIGATTLEGNSNGWSWHFDQAPP